ncbi:MAG: hypothetical protein KGL63_09845 [Betaproteobacteria bacterium]|uniref:hypothetical protein n=1 Tax=Acidiphilium TaxID=522 RepID=UPI00157AF60F|nr:MULTISPECIES: hypothetical protein [Acidiphilium]MDE2343672.1 hypothetical protein [Betaproteobacteria bacterium]UNC16205.1 hypothetical protein FE249_18290 [Acidiphilium multivorum]
MNQHSAVITPTNMRVRKAWRVTVRGYDHSAVFHAATAAKARMQAWNSLSDVTSGVRIVDVVARRHPFEDHLLPPRDPVIDQLTAEELHCLLHSYGADYGDPVKAGYRDYYYAERTNPFMVGLTEKGLMSPMSGDVYGEGMTYFVLTDAGRHAVRSVIPLYRGDPLPEAAQPALAAEPSTAAPAEEATHSPS